MCADDATEDVLSGKIVVFCCLREQSVKAKFVRAAFHLGWTLDESTRRRLAPDNPLAPPGWLHVGSRDVGSSRNGLRTGKSPVSSTALASRGRGCSRQRRRHRKLRLHAEILWSSIMGGEWIRPGCNFASLGPPSPSLAAAGDDGHEKMNGNERSTGDFFEKHLSRRASSQLFSAKTSHRRKRVQNHNDGERKIAWTTTAMDRFGLDPSPIWRKAFLECRET
ncbi:hypothetical protein BDZ89DRAFT_1046064 [Hymenopellis radicata]|nr:hypothetical protein BDZ89DRAFT_1046064 [Hymenopellis radicata]